MNSRVNMNKHNGLSTFFWRRVRELCEVNNKQNNRLKSETIDLSPGRWHTSFDRDEKQGCEGWKHSLFNGHSIKSDSLVRNS